MSSMIALIEDVVAMPTWRVEHDPSTRGWVAFEDSAANRSPRVSKWFPQYHWPDALAYAYVRSHVARDLEEVA